jgi:hypothetical protein
MQKQISVKPEPEELVAAEDSVKMVQSREEKQTPRLRQLVGVPILLEDAAF